jgi:hypothetical protein
MEDDDSFERDGPEEYLNSSEEPDVMVIITLQITKTPFRLIKEIQIISYS